MNTKDIRNALKAHLATAALPSGTAEAWPNVGASSEDVPRFDASFSSVTQTLANTGAVEEEIEVEIGNFNVVVIVAHGGGEDEALDIADIVSLRFGKGTDLTVAGGSLTVTGRPDIRGGYPTDTDYRVPVIIPYLAIKD